MKHLLYFYKKIEKKTAVIYLNKGSNCIQWPRVCLSVGGFDVWRRVSIRVLRGIIWGFVTVPGDICNFEEETTWGFNVFHSAPLGLPVNYSGLHTEVWILCPPFVFVGYMKMWAVSCKRGFYSHILNGVIFSLVWSVVSPVGPKWRLGGDLIISLNSLLEGEWSSSLSVWQWSRCFRYNERESRLDWIPELHLVMLAGKLGFLKFSSHWSSVFVSEFGCWSFQNRATHTLRSSSV